MQTTNIFITFFFPFLMIIELFWPLKITARLDLSNSMITCRDKSAGSETDETVGVVKSSCINFFRKDSSSYKLLEYN